MKVDILDPATLQPQQFLDPPWETTFEIARVLVFSPDSCMLTCSGSGDQELFLVTWDIQTGGVVSAIEQQGPDVGYPAPCIAYSTNGRTVGVLYPFPITPIISIYDVVSGMHTHDIDHAVHANSHPLAYLHPFDIWTYGESLRFASVGPTITIWEVGFTPGAEPTAVETFSLPRSIGKMLVPRSRSVSLSITRIQPLPSSYRVVFNIYAGPSGSAVIVWDTRDSKSMLNCTGANFNSEVTFSSDGRLFACPTWGSGIYLWKESHTGYTFNGTLPSITGLSLPLLSPNGESIVAVCDSTIKLWHTKSFTSSSILARVPRNAEDFVLEFHPNKPLAVEVRWKHNIATVLDLNSGLPQLTIDAGIKVYGIRMTESTAVLIGNAKLITWNLPGGTFPPDTRMGVEDSAQIVNFAMEQGGDVESASISSDFHYVALLRETVVEKNLCSRLDIYDTSSGQCLSRHTAQHRLWDRVRFAPGEYTILLADWYADLEAFMPTRNGLDREGEGSWVGVDFDVERPVCGDPWRSSRGYQVKGNGWIFGPGGERLLMLPPPWQSSPVRRVWNGKFLALLHGELPEPVILDLNPD